MAYIGKTPVIGNFQICDAITVVDAQAAYTMQVGGVNVSPESANHMLVSLNGILQAPTSSFTVSGSTITFASALETGDVIDFIQILGNVLDLGVPSDNTVSASKLTNDIISGKTELTSEPASTDELLISDAGTLKRIDYSLISNRPAFEAHLSANQTLTDATTTKIEFDTEVFDTDDCYDNSTNYRFTPNVAGKYLITVQPNFDSNAASNLANTLVAIYKNGSVYKQINFAPNDNFLGTGFISLSAIIDMNGSSDYVEGFVNVNDTSGNPDLEAETGDYKKATSFSGYKLIGV
jgi:hypothetical protein